MGIVKSKFDFLELREFLVESYSKFPKKNNWRIDRWNFTRYVSQSFNDTFESWPDTVGVWKDESENIVAVVNSEGENSGEAFFQFSNYDFSKDELNEIVDHLETLPKGKDGDELFLQVRINEDDNILKELLKKRGYEFNNWYEETSSMEIDGIYQVNLPSGFTIKNGNSVSDYDKGFAHGRAFGYYNGDTPDNNDAEKAFKSMRNAPDYDPKLDLSVVDINGEVASFVTIWFDKVNEIAILEPVGTIPKYRRMGLGKALIYHGINKVKDLRAKKMYVGSDQEFYLAIGFEIEYKQEVWFKSFSN